MTTIEDANKMLVADLKNELKQRGASTNGKKAELLERLVELLEKEKTSQSNQGGFYFSEEPEPHEKTTEEIHEEKPVGPTQVAPQDHPSVNTEENLATVPEVSEKPKEFIEEENSRSQLTEDVTSNIPHSAEEKTDVGEQPTAKEESTLNNEPDSMEMESVAISEAHNVPISSQPASEQSLPQIFPTKEALEINSESPKASQTKPEIQQPQQPEKAQTSTENEMKTDTHHPTTVLITTAAESTDNNDNNNTSNSLSLGERIKQNMKKRKSEEDLAREQQPQPLGKTTHVRIDNFQRPLMNKNLMKWLSEKTGSTVNEETLWINSIKTHCYVDFPTVEEAETCINKISGLKFPDTNTQLLSAHFTTVSVKEAPTSHEGTMKPGEWLEVRNKKSTDRGSISNNNSSSNSVLMKRKSEENSGSTNTATSNQVGANLFKKATVSALNTTGPLSIATATATALSPQGGGAGGKPPLKSITSYRTVTLNSPTETGRRPSFGDENQFNTSDKNNKIKSKSLEELFRKTTTQPPIYWLPVEEEVVERRRALKNRLGTKK
jgi:hypothetical protein